MSNHLKQIFFIIILSSSTLINGMFDTELMKYSVDAMKHIVRNPDIALQTTDPFSPAFVNSMLQERSSWSYTFQAVGVSIAAATAFVVSLWPWKSVVETTVSTAKKLVDTIDKNIQPPTSPRTKRAKQEVNNLSIQQLQLLALTEEQSNPSSTYFRNKYQEKIDNKVK